MEMLEFVEKNLLYKKTHTKILIVCLYLIVAAVHGYVLVFDHTVDFDQFVCQLILVGIIHLWIYAAPKFSARIRSLKDAFPEDSKYNDLCENNKILVKPLRFSKKPLLCNGNVLRFFISSYGASALFPSLSESLSFTL